MDTSTTDDGDIIEVYKPLIRQDISLHVVCRVRIERTVNIVPASGSDLYDGSRLVFTLPENKGEHEIYVPDEAMDKVMEVLTATIAFFSGTMKPNVPETEKGKPLLEPLPEDDIPF